MKQLAGVLVVVTCFAAGGAIGSTHMTNASKVQDFTNPELCFLEVAATESDSALVRQELNRRNVECTAELKSEGKASLEKTVQRFQLQAFVNSQNRAVAKRDLREKQETDRLIRCAANGGQAEPNCRNGY